MSLDRRALLKMVAAFSATSAITTDVALAKQEVIEKQVDWQVGSRVSVYHDGRWHDIAELQDIDVVADAIEAEISPRIIRKLASDRFIMELYVGNPVMLNAIRTAFRPLEWVQMRVTQRPGIKIEFDAQVSSLSINLGAAVTIRLEMKVGNVVIGEPV